MEFEFVCFCFCFRPTRDIKRTNPFQMGEEIIAKYQKFVDDIKQSFSSEPLRKFQQNLAQTKVCSNEGLCLYSDGDNTEGLSIMTAKNLFI